MTAVFIKQQQKRRVGLRQKSDRGTDTCSPTDPGSSIKLNSVSHKRKLQYSPTN